MNNNCHAALLLNFLASLIHHKIMYRILSLSSFSFYKPGFDVPPVTYVSPQPVKGGGGGGKGRTAPYLNLQNTKDKNAYHKR